MYLYPAPRVKLFQQPDAEFIWEILEGSIRLQVLPPSTSLPFSSVPVVCLHNCVLIYLKSINKPIVPPISMQIAGIPESGRIKKCHFLAWINTCGPSATVQWQTPPAACYFAAPRGTYNKAH